jgi:hypothetical protein
MFRPAPGSAERLPLPHPPSPHQGAGFTWPRFVRTIPARTGADDARTSAAKVAEDVIELVEWRRMPFSMLPGHAVTSSVPAKYRRCTCSGRCTSITCAETGPFTFPHEWGLSQVPNSAAALSSSENGWFGKHAESRHSRFTGLRCRSLRLRGRSAGRSTSSGRRSLRRLSYRRLHQGPLSRRPGR